MRSWGVFFIVVCDGREIVWRFWRKCISPVQSLKWRLRGGKKAEWGFFCKIDSSVFNLMANLHLSLLLGFDGSETVHPPHFLQGVSGCWFFFFLILFVVTHIFNVSVMLFDQTHFLRVRFSSETYTACFALSISRYLQAIAGRPRPSPAAHQSTALLLAVNSWAVDLWK